MAIVIGSTTIDDLCDIDACIAGHMFVANSSRYTESESFCSLKNKGASFFLLNQNKFRD